MFCRKFQFFRLEKKQFNTGGGGGGGVKGYWAEKGQKEETERASGAASFTNCDEEETIGGKCA